MIEIYIIAYNNLFCVEYQIKAYKAFLQDDHKLIIIDSNCGEFHKNTNKKREICNKYGVEFLELPNHLSNIGTDPSYILAHKLNYVFYNIVKVNRPKYFAFIDQDFFPFKKFSVKDQLDRFGMYGDVLENTNGPHTSSHKIEELVDCPWCIHPWLSFYKFDLVENANMDWGTCPGFDTGGKNWENFISKTNLSKKDYWLRHKTIMYFPFTELSDSDYAFFNWNGKKIYSQVQIYDGKFIHMLNSKFLDDPNNPKTNWCKGFLDMALLIDGDTSFDQNNGFCNDGPANRI